MAGHTKKLVARVRRVTRGGALTERKLSKQTKAGRKRRKLTAGVIKSIRKAAPPGIPGI